MPARTEEEVKIKYVKIKKADFEQPNYIDLVYKNIKLTAELQAALSLLKKYFKAIEILKDKGICLVNGRLYFDYDDYDENDLGLSTGFYKELTVEEEKLLEKVLGSLKTPKTRKKIKDDVDLKEVE